MRRWRGWILGSASGLLVLLAAGLLVVPAIFNIRLQMAPETGLRYQEFHRLLALGPFGRGYARDYAGKTFRRWRNYGRGYVLTPGILPAGSSADLVRSVLGEPDLRASDHDIWWMSRDRTGRKLLVGEEPFRTVEWNRRLVAEYDGRGFLERLFIPGEPARHFTPGREVFGERSLPAPERSPPAHEAAPPVPEAQPSD